MELSKEFVREVLTKYFDETFSKLLPEVFKNTFKVDGLIQSQDCLPIAEATRRYDLSRRTLYNYHNRRYINLYSSEGKTFISIQELEAHIKKHPLPIKDQIATR